MKCKRCKVDKPLIESGRCQGCEDYCKEYYENNKQKEIDRAKRNLDKDRVKTNKYKRELRVRNPVGHMIQSFRSKSKLNNLPFNLTKDDIFIPEFCPILGLKLKMNSGTVGPNSISLDRLVPELGYVKGNVMVISHKANTIKNNATLEELEKLVSWMRNKLC